MRQTKESNKRALGRVVIYISVHLVSIYTLAFSNVLLVLALNFMVHRSSYCKCSLAWCEWAYFFHLQEGGCVLPYGRHFHTGHGTAYGIFIVIQWSIRSYFIESQWICRMPCRIPYENASRKGVRILPSLNTSPPNERIPAPICRYWQN